MISRRSLFGLPLAFAVPAGGPQSSFLKPGHVTADPVLLLQDRWLMELHATLLADGDITATEAINRIARRAVKLAYPRR